MYPTTQPAATDSHDRPAELTPADFDPAACPILSLHWFGIRPVRSLKRQRQIEHVHRLGARAVAELLHEVAAGENLDRALESYGRLTPGMLKALDGDRFPPLPIYEVQQ